MLELQNISKAYGDRTVLSDISLSIEKGEIVSILGPSGCGKTTLLNLVLGLVTATDGRILFDGVDLTHVPMEKRGFNIVFQDYALFPNLNAYENIVYGLRNRPDVSTRSEVDDLIDLLGLDCFGLFECRLGFLDIGTGLCELIKSVVDREFLFIHDYFLLET